jgi:hypothetical protein
MARYGDIYYGLPTSIYGEVARSAYSADPFVATAVTYTEVKLTWSPIDSGGEEDYAALRVVRNQYAFPETQDDGFVVLEATGSFPTAVSDTVNLGTGRYAFYTIWVLLETSGTWISVGQTHVLVPSAHTSNMRRNFIDEDGAVTITPLNSLVLMNTHDKLMSYLPRAMTSGGSATDTYDPNSTLSKFLEGFSFTLDELLTYTDLIVPGISGKYSNPGLVDLQSLQLGLPLDPNGLTRTQKQMVRNAIYLYSRKGTVNGIEGWAKAVTGYDTTATVGGNLLLSIQDSSFVNGTGFWQAVDGATISAANTQSTSALNATGDYVVDEVWSAKIVATTPGSGAIPQVRLGMDDPIRTGIPVKAGQEYKLSYAIKSSSSGAQISYVYIKWFNALGAMLSDSQTAATVSVTSSFAKKTYTQTAPAGAAFAAIRLGFVGTGGKTYYLARVQFAKSSVTNFSDSRAVLINLNPAKVNYLPNPSLVAGGTAVYTDPSDTVTYPTTTLLYAPSASTMLRTVLHSSSNSMYLQLKTSVGVLPVIDFYTFSIYARASAATSVSLDLFAVTSGNLILSNATTKTLSLTTSWQRYEITIKIDDDVDISLALLDAEITGSAASGTILEFDQAQIEQGYAATSYFDGNIANIGAGWTSGYANQNNSTSYLYPNRVSKILRLNAEVENYLPRNTPYFIISNVGVEKFGLTQ